MTAVSALSARANEASWNMYSETSRTMVSMQCFHYAGRNSQPALVQEWWQTKHGFVPPEHIMFALLKQREYVLIVSSNFSELCLISKTRRARWVCLFPGSIPSHILPLVEMPKDVMGQSKDFINYGDLGPTVEKYTTG